jgi:hypothetical protein
MAFASSAHALTLAQAAKLADLLERTGKELSQSTSNLLGMTAGMREPEDGTAQRIYDRAANIDQKHLTQLFIVVSIFLQMKDSRDQAVVRNYVGILAGSAVQSADSAIDGINRDIVKLSSPAAIAEAQKARDLIQKIRDEIKPMAPGN